MRQVGGIVTQAARLAGQERRAFSKLIKKHGVDPQHLGDAYFPRQHMTKFTVGAYWISASSYQIGSYGLPVP